MKPNRHYPAFLPMLAIMLAGCDPDAAVVDGSTFRSDYWAEVECINGTCWGLHPMAATDDLWAMLITMDQLTDRIESGRYIKDAAGAGFGRMSCAPGTLPTTMPEVHCWTVSGTLVNHCFGGDGTYLTRIRPACEQQMGFVAANTEYPPGSCDTLPSMPWPSFDSMMAHNTKLNVARVGLDGDSFMLYPGCSF